MNISGGSSGGATHRLSQIGTDNDVDVLSLPALTTGSNTIGAVNKVTYFRTDTFTGTGNGTSVDATANPIGSFGILVRATGGTPTLWTLVLEGSIDGTNFSTILTHTNTLGLNVNLWSGALISPCRYFRSRVVALTLGGASNIISDIVGM